jgi:hypothetical protein
MLPIRFPQQRLTLRLPSVCIVTLNSGGAALLAVDTCSDQNMHILGGVGSSESFFMNPVPHLNQLNRRNIGDYCCIRGFSVGNHFCGPGPNQAY